MSLITCCPACGTMFRVVPDQLKISEGWVRCGHCAEVFDATAHMMDDPPSQFADDAAAGEPAAQVPPANALLRADPAPDAIAAAHAPAEPDSELHESPLDQPFVFRRSDMGDGDDLPSVTPPPAYEDFGESSSLLPEGEAAARQVSFMRDAHRRAFWKRPVVRIAMLLVAGVLASLLAVQVAWQEHNRLAAAYPGLRPALESLCEALGCRIGPPRQIETVAIENSSFVKLRADAYRLQFTVRNGAAFEVEAPAMELTLTDTQDQPVLRRVLAPAELGAAAPTLAPGAEWTASVALAVNANGQASRIAGYRLLAFYP